MAWWTPLLCALLAAGCASPYDFRTMPVAEVCYVGATEWQYRRVADEELKRRGERCENHRDEIIAVHKARMAAARVEDVNQQGIRSQPPGDAVLGPAQMR